jgi:hypothetical protein
MTSNFITHSDFSLSINMQKNDQQIGMEFFAFQIMLCESNKNKKFQFSRHLSFSKSFFMIKVYLAVDHGYRMI